MPTYDVKCKECDLIYEISHRITENHPPCKECGSLVQTHILSPPGISFKGAGWTPKYHGNDTTARIRDRTDALKSGGSVNDVDD